jgi:hypothetical protein
MIFLFYIIPSKLLTTSPKGMTRQQERKVLSKHVFQHNIELGSILFKNTIPQQQGRVISNTWKFCNQ